MAALAVALACALTLVELTGLVFPAALPVLVSLYMTGTVRTARVVVASTLIAVPSVVAVVELERGIPSFTLCNATQLGGFVATSAIGLAVASQRRSREIIEERARRAVESHEAEGRRRVGGERLRIAQELTT